MHPRLADFTPCPDLQIWGTGGVLIVTTAYQVIDLRRLQWPLAISPMLMGK